MYFIGHTKGPLERPCIWDLICSCPRYIESDSQGEDRNQVVQRLPSVNKQIDRLIGRKTDIKKIRQTESYNKSMAMVIGLCCEAASVRQLTD